MSLVLDWDISQAYCTSSRSFLDGFTYVWNFEVCVEGTVGHITRSSAIYCRIFHWHLSIMAVFVLQAHPRSTILFSIESLDFLHVN